MLKNCLLKSSLFLLLCLMMGCSTHYTHRSALFSTNTIRLTPEYVKIKNGQIEYYRIGHGSAIILIPGYLTDVTSWNRTFINTLAKNHQLFIINNRNVAGSITYSSKYKTADLAADVAQLIKNLRLKKPFILGISMGGMLAQQVGVSYPNAVAGLILINTMIAGKESIHPDYRIANAVLNMPVNKWARYQLALKFFFPPSWRPQMMFKILFDRFKPDEYCEINIELLRKPQQSLLLDWSLDNRSAEKLHKVHLPVLILSGDADVVIPPSNSIILWKKLTRRKLLLWREGGHAMIYQFPQQMGHEINKFILETELKESSLH